jgi:hypothetical protein
MAKCLVLAGMMFEALGVLITFWGLRATLGEFAGEGVLKPAVDQLRRTSSGVRTWVERARQKLGGRPKPTVVGVGTIMSGSGTFDLRARVGFPRIRHKWNWPRAIHELDGRTRQLADQIANVREYAEDEIKRLDSAIVDVRTSVDSESKRLEELARRVATVDLRRQMAGLGLVLFGVFLQGLSLLIATP